MKKKILVLALSALFLVGCGATDSENEYSKTFFAMDTVMTITASGQGAEEAVLAMEEMVEDLDKKLSTEEAGSQVYELNKNGQGSLDEETFGILQETMSLYQITDGAFDVAIYPVMREWGFLGGSEKQQVPDEASLQTALSLADPENIKLDEDSDTVSFERDGMAIDFGGIAKGYTSEKLTEYLEGTDLDWALLSLGGNIQVYGEKKAGKLWNIAIEDPDDTSSYIGSVQVEGGTAVITSGGYQRYFEEDGQVYHHIIDPSTGYPAQSGLKSATIVSTDGTLADGLSTSVFIMGKDAATVLWKNHSDEFDMVLVTDSDEVYITEGLKDRYTDINGVKASVIYNK